MEKYVLNLTSNKKENTAMYKAKNDVAKILVNNGFKNIDYVLYNNSKIGRIFSILRTYVRCSKITSGIVVYQYPLGPNIDKLLLSKFYKNRNIKVIGLIHDINSIQFSKSTAEDLANLKRFDGIIAHNKKMESWLRNNGINTPIYSIKVFDYLTSINPNKEIQNRILFAGNLVKASFLTKLNTKIKFDVYGPNPSKYYPDCVDYKGVLAPDDLAKKMDEKYGLIWDGDSIDKCTGVAGNYEKINNPHKLSLYLSMGIPVIAWRRAAISEFIESNTIGFVVSSLDEIDTVLNKLNEEDYIKFKNNAINIGHKIKKGEYTLQAVNKLLEALDKKENCE